LLQYREILSLSCLTNMRQLLSPLNRNDFFCSPNDVFNSIFFIFGWKYYHNIRDSLLSHTTCKLIHPLRFLQIRIITCK
jgi:hypothetical protein